jgi:hypothetical protein
VAVVLNLFTLVFDLVKAQCSRRSFQEMA